jgi:MFS superfamily sulfate permease-like transporter
VTSVDVTAADALSELDDELRAKKIELYFAEMKDPVKDKLRRFELFERFERKFFATIDDAVSAYRAAFPTEWTMRGRTSG